MKIEFYSTGSGDSTSSVDITITTSLTASRHPQVGNELLTHGHLNSLIVGGSNASQMTGVLAATRMPAYTGDVVVAAGSSSMVINQIAIGNSSENFVAQINAAGRVAAVRALQAGDIPELAWNKIQAATIPTTLSGLGITNGINKTGALVSWATVHLAVGTPISANHPATADHSSNQMHGLGERQIGTIFRSESSAVPANCLRTNGGFVSQAAYPDLYALIGSSNQSSQGILGAGRPWQSCSQIIASEGWNPSSLNNPHITPIEMAFGTIFIVGTYIHCIGGVLHDKQSFEQSHGDLSADTIHSDYAVFMTNRCFRYNLAGGSGTTRSYYSAPIPVACGEVVVYNNYVYIFGGYSVSEGASDGNGYLVRTITGVNQNIYRAPVNFSTGEVGSFSLIGTIPGDYARVTGFIQNQYLTLVGLTASAGMRVAHRAVIFQGGGLGAWTQLHAPQTPGNFSAGGYGAGGIETFPTNMAGLSRLQTYSNLTVSGVDGDSAYFFAHLAAAMLWNRAFSVMTKSTAIVTGVGSPTRYVFNDSGDYVSSNRLEISAKVDDGQYGTHVRPSPHGPMIALRNHIVIFTHHGSYDAVTDNEGNSTMTYRVEGAQAFIPITNVSTGEVSDTVYVGGFGGGYTAFMGYFPGQVFVWGGFAVPGVWPNGGTFNDMEPFRRKGVANAMLFYAIHQGSYGEQPNPFSPPIDEYGATPTHGAADYTPYENNFVSIVPAGQFQLPDTTSTLPANTYDYIRAT